MRSWEDMLADADRVIEQRIDALPKVGDILASLACALMLVYHGEGAFVLWVLLVGWLLNLAQKPVARWWYINRG